MFKLHLFGPFQLLSPKSGAITLGTKLQALLALLATDENGTRTRAYLRAMLWENSDPDHAGASLRGALTSLRSTLNKDADIINANWERVFLDLSRIKVVSGTPGSIFLEGLDIPGVEAFEEWLTQMRRQQAVIPAKTANIVPIRPETTSAGLLPRVAVIPFQLRNHDPAFEIFGDIIAEEMTRNLAASSLMSVISHLSTRKMSGHSHRLDAIRRSLGCDYLISGSIVSVGATSRLLVTFHDAGKGTVLWTDSFTENNAAIIRGESEVLREIVQRVQRSILSQTAAELETRHLLTAPAFRLLIGGINNLHTHLPDNFSKAQTYLEAACKACPKHPLPIAWLAFWHWMSAQNGFSSDRKQASEKSRVLAAEAIDRDPSCAVARATVAMNYSHILRDFDLASDAYEKARIWAPNEPLSALLDGAMQAFIGHSAQAICLTEKARALSPLDPQKYYLDLITGTAHLTGGDAQKALDLAVSSLDLNPHYASTHRLKIISLSALGREEEAQNAGRDYLALDPEFSVTRYAQTHPACTGEVGKYWVEMLRTARLPE